MQAKHTSRIQVETGLFCYLSYAVAFVVDLLFSHFNG